MSCCALCGMQLAGDAQLCAHHDYARENGWAADNRLMCDLLHRGIVPPRREAIDENSEVHLSAS